MEDFENIYNVLKETYGKEFKPTKRLITGKQVLYMYFAWLILSTVKRIFFNFFGEGSIIYSITSLINSVIMLSCFISVFIILNINMGYWQRAPMFKKRVGTNFWNMINHDIEYNSDREEIDRELYKKELENIYEVSILVDIEEELKYKNLRMCTIRFNTASKKRLTGTFAFIDNCHKDIKKDDLKDLNFEHYDEIINMQVKNEKLYMFFDAKEVFYFNGEDFFKEEDLKDDYNRFKDLLKIMEYIK